MTIVNMVGGGSQSVMMDGTYPVPYNGSQSGTATVYYTSSASSEGRTDFDMVLNGRIYSGLVIYTRQNGFLSSQTVSVSGSIPRWSSVNGKPYLCVTSPNSTVCSVVSFNDDTPIVETFNASVADGYPYAFAISETEVELFYSSTDQRQRFTKQGGTWSGGVVTATTCPNGSNYAASNGKVRMNRNGFTYEYDGETDGYSYDDPTDADASLYNYEGWIASLYTTTYSTGGFKEFTLYNGFTAIYSKRYTQTGSGVESSDLIWPLTIGKGIIMTIDEIFILETGTSLNIEASGTNTPNAMDVFLLDDDVSVSGDRCRTVTVNRKTTASAVVIGDTCYIFTTEA